MGDYAALIERLEKAEGPDWNLDADIAEALRLVPPGMVRVPFTNAFCYEGPDAVSAVQWPAPKFTGPGIDAALTQVPEKHTIYMTLPHRADGGKHRELAYACCAPPGLGGPQWAKKRAHVSAFHRRPPIALVIAALRARQHMKETQHE